MSDVHRRLLFVIPAYNESMTLRSVVADVQKEFPHASIVVVDDGSTDDTAAVAHAAGAEVIQMPYNTGIGTAVQTGLIFALRFGYDFAVQFDGDGQHCADQVHALLAATDECDVAIGSRFMPGGRYAGGSMLRRVGTAVLNLTNLMLLRQRFTDSTSGFRVFNRAAIRFLARHYADDYPEPESILALVRSGFKVHEVPVVMRRRAGGNSSITNWRSLYYMLKVSLALIVDATRSHGRRAS